MENTALLVPLDKIVIISHQAGLCLLIPLFSYGAKLLHSPIGDKPGALRQNILHKYVGSIYEWFIFVFLKQLF